MRFVLIIPPSPWLISDRDFPFLGPLYVASAASTICHTEVCDLSGIPEEHWHIPFADVYGITGASPNYPQMQKIIAKLKKRDPECTVIAGGVHATLLPRHVLDTTGADLVFCGEAEDGIRRYLMGQNPRDIPGFRGRDFETEAPLVEDIDEFWPARDMIDIYDYLQPGTHKYLSREREATIITSRGCPYVCAFCASRNLNHGAVRYRRIDSIIRELEHLRDRFGARLVYLLDDTFSVDIDRAIEVCGAIKPLGINWYCLTRVDRASPKLFKAMKDSGCLSVTYGIESGSDYMLKKMKKGTTSEQALDAIHMAEDSGLKVRAQMIVGFPGENDSTVEETANFIREARTVTAWGVHVFQPFPGCDVWCNPDKYGLEAPENSAEDFSMYHTIGRPDDKLTDNPRVQYWHNYLRTIAGEHNIDKK